MFNSAVLLPGAPLAGVAEGGGAGLLDRTSAAQDGFGGGGATTGGGVGVSCAVVGTALSWGECPFGCDLGAGGLVQATQTKV